MRITIKNPAIRAPDSEPWGDDYFGTALAQELAARGCDVLQEFWPDWRAQDAADATIVLRGLRRWTPSTAGLRILWILSHPAQVTREELDEFDLVLTASRLHCEILGTITQTPVRVARQCTDDRLFRANSLAIEEEADVREGLLYVARSRGVRRDMAQWLDEQRLPARIIGNGWGRFGLKRLVEAEHLANDRLPERYRRAKFALNDHWLDMRTFGYVNNRILDCMACGLPVVTDDFPELREVFADALIYVNDAKELSEAVSMGRQEYIAALRRCRDKWNEIGDYFSFAYRADEILDWISRPPGRTRCSAADSASMWSKDALVILNGSVYHEEQRTAYLERKVRQQHEELAASREREEVLERAKRESEEARARSELERDEFRDDLTSMLGSRSWRLTWPLRTCGAILRRCARAQQRWLRRVRWEVRARLLMPVEKVLGRIRRR